MINKKNLLGKTPAELGLKDAVHTAIVSVRAGCPIDPGTRCTMRDGEAFPDGKGPGIADPWLTSRLKTGESFWLVMNQDEIPNVQHVWEHPKVDFTPTTKPVKRNRCIQEVADDFGVTYEQLMAAAELTVDKNRSSPYPGKLSEKEFDEAIENFDRYTFWDEWSSEIGYEFENVGSNCCPEYDHPRGSDIFHFAE